jgi:WhiB family transcriptional regulator, redox-sensing transcriptional regulator
MDGEMEHRVVPRVQQHSAGLDEEHTETRGDRYMSEVRRQVAMPPRPSWAWQDAAACRGKDIVLFFGPDGERQPEREIRERKAKMVCASCPVRGECLDYAVSRPEKYGTWGGLNEEERASERRRRMRRANAA